MFQQEKDHQGSISPTFHEQLLLSNIPNAQKDTVKLSVFFALLGSARPKGMCKMMMKKLTPVLDAING